VSEEGFDKDREGLRLDLTMVRGVLELAVVCGAGGHRDHLHVPQDRVDERKEQNPLKAIFVKLLRRAVRGGHDHTALLPQDREERFQQQGICDICDLELVETDDVGLPEDIIGNLLEMCLVSRLSIVRLQLVEPLVDVQHEGVEMGT
jgi:hypothetical protein